MTLYFCYWLFMYNICAFYSNLEYYKNTSQVLYFIFHKSLHVIDT